MANNSVFQITIYCTKTYKSLGNLKNHLKNIHPNCKEMKEISEIEKIIIQQDKLYKKTFRLIINKSFIMSTGLRWLKYNLESF